MKAIVQTKYGPADVLELREIDKPLVGDDDVLVRARAASVHPDVWHVMTGQPYVLRLMGAGLFKPKNAVPGTDLAGYVESVGANVTRFKRGDEVFGESLLGMQWINGGAFAEYVRCPQDGLALKPAGVSFEHAAAVPTAGLIVLQNLRNETAVRAGQKVLINGAAGGVGSVALQLAKAIGAEVTGVDAPEKLDMLRALGADHVVDYSREDFTQGDQRYDLVFDVPGNHTFAAVRRALSPEGKYVLIGHDHFGTKGHRALGSLPRMFALMAMTPFVKQLPKVTFAMPSKQVSMETLRALLEQGTLTPIIDRAYPLSQAADAMRYLQEGRARGKIVLTIA